MKLILSSLFLFGALLPPLTAQDPPAPIAADVETTADAVETEPGAPSGATTADPKIRPDSLKVLLRPLDSTALEEELKAWMHLLSEQIVEVGSTELKLKGVTEARAADPDSVDPENEEALTTQLVKLREEEAAMVERVNTVIDSFEAKGGDPAAARAFIDAVTDIREVADATSMRTLLQARFHAWLTNPDGGQLFLKKAVLALVLLLIFWMISRYAGKLAAKALSKQRGASKLLINFAKRTAGGVVFVVGVLVAIATLGIPIGPMAAALGAGGFIIGFALQETLGNFASGLMIMVYRPFDVDDFVDVAGVSGKVEAMSLVSTSLLTPDNKQLVIPNSKVWGDIITNFTARDLRRVDLVFGIGYGDDIEKARKVLEEVVKAHEKVLDDPALTLEVGELADSSVNILCRPWVKTEDYWQVNWDLTRTVKKRFDEEGISIPFPQRDVHVIKELAE